MISRVVLTLAVTLGLGAAAAQAQGPDALSVVVDQAKIAKLPPGTATLVIGNPMIADVAMLKAAGSMVVTGKGYGQTNLIAIDSQGQVLDEKQIIVVPTKAVLVVQRGTSRVSYSCNPNCVPTVQIGDDQNAFTEAGAQIGAHNALANSNAPVSAAK